MYYKFKYLQQTYFLDTFVVYMIYIKTLELQFSSFNLQPISWENGLIVKLNGKLDNVSENVQFYLLLFKQLG